MDPEPPLAEPHSAAIHAAEQARLSLGEVVMPGEAGVDAALDGRAWARVALHVLATADYSSDEGLARLLATLAALDPEALAVVAIYAVLELAELGFDATVVTAQS